LKTDLLQYLVCPTCRGQLSLTVSEERAGEVESGRLRCNSGCASYPIVRGVPRFVDADRYAGSFSRQREYVRRHFDQYRADRSGDRLFLPTTGFDADALKQGLTLEVGCGYGRFVDVVQRLGGTIIGVDLSTHSIDLAREFVGSRPGVHLVQCDLFSLPFRRETFDHLFSIGVLHHTPDTRQAFEAIVPYGRPSSRIAIWTYHPRNKVSANRWRVVTTRVPASVLYAFCIANQALFSWIRALPGGRRFNAIVPGTPPSAQSPFWMRVMNDFDNLSPKYAHVHTPEQVRGWYEAAGLEDVRVLTRDTAVVGRRRPARANAASTAPAMVAGRR
jgi:SAM-dependent methyltransferase